MPLALTIDDYISGAALYDTKYELRVFFSGEGQIQFSDTTRIDYLTLRTLRSKTKNLEAVLDVAFYLGQPINVKVFDRTQPRILCLFNLFKKKRLRSTHIQIYWCFLSEFYDDTEAINTNHPGIPEDDGCFWLHHYRGICVGIVLFKNPCEFFGKVYPSRNTFRFTCFKKETRFFQQRGNESASRFFPLVTLSSTIDAMLCIRQSLQM